MATVQLYGPYYVLQSPQNKFKPGEVRRFGFGPWPFRRGTATVSAAIQDYSSVEGTLRITVESIEYEINEIGQDNIFFTYRNTGDDEIQGWLFNLSIVEP
jgi:hypothetical protein